MKLSTFLLFIPAIATLSLASCMDPMMSAGYGGGYNTYSTLPRNYSGNAYYHQGRYYFGGQYQTGSYFYQGRQYTNRYYHNGQYYYGGQHQHHSNPGIRPSSYRPSNGYPSGYRPSNSYPSNYPPSNYHPSGGHSSGNHSSGGHSEHHEGWNRPSGRR